MSQLTKLEIGHIYNMKGDRPQNAYKHNFIVLQILESDDCLEYIGVMLTRSRMFRNNIKLKSHHIKTGTKFKHDVRTKFMVQPLIKNVPLDKLRETGCLTLSGLARVKCRIDPIMHTAMTWPKYLKMVAPKTRQKVRKKPKQDNISVGRG